MIRLQDVTLRRGARVLLERASVTIHAGEKVGLVGRNGAGKSTLFRLIDGSLHEDSGEFTLPAGWRMAQVAQHMPETAEPATDFVVAGDTRLMAARAALVQAEAGHAAHPQDADAGLALAHAHSDLADAGAHDATARAQALILGLGFRVDQLMAPVNSFSGGWRMRLQLARALMCPSDLLLLDEPTNHLDLDALVWLEDWLRRYAGTLIVISHDREFLDAATRVTLHIEHQRLVRYGGNYSAFEEQRAAQLALQQAAFARQQEKIAHLQRFIDRFKAKATKARQAQSRVKALERMERIAPVLADAEFSFEFREPASLPNPMLTLREARLGYGDTAILRSVTRSVMAGQRIGILGANGQGKSTLVKTIAGSLPALAGTVTRGKGLAIGYFAQQELDLLSAGDSPLTHMTRLVRERGVPDGETGREQDLRNFLGRFNFAGDMVHQNVDTLSGGERARLVLAMIVWQRPNLLLLDEPTNHLDLATREALSVALNEFEGTVLLVSHDRALLRAVCDEFWLVARGAVEPFDGDLDDYQRFLLDEARRQRPQTSAAEAPDAPVLIAQQPHFSRGNAEFSSEAAERRPAAADDALNPAQRRKAQAQQRAQQAERLRPLRREIERIETQMAELGHERAALEERLCTALPPTELADAGRRLKDVQQALEAAEERWLVLSQQLEQATSAA